MTNDTLLGFREREEHFLESADRDHAFGDGAIVDLVVSCPMARQTSRTLLARLVERIVTRQVEFLVQSESVTATIAGHVRDDDGV